MRIGTSALYPSVPAIAWRDASGVVTIDDVARGCTLRAEAALGEAVARVLDGAPVDGALALLPDDHPVRTTLSAIAGAPAVPLTAASAVALDGFDTLFVELLGRCNERCVHCYAGSGPQVSTALDEATCRAVLRDAHELGFARVQFTGGDPLLCPFLPELVAFASQLGFEQREIYTNGLALGDRLLDALASSGPSFALSLYAHDPEVHDAVTRTPGSQVRTLAAIDRLVARGLPVRVSIIVMKENADAIDATIALLAAHGVASIGVSASHAAGRGTFFEADLSRYGRTAAHGHAPGAAREGRLCVASDGRVHPCIFHRTTTLGDVRARGLRAIAQDPRPSRAPMPRAGDGADATVLECRSCRLTARALAMAARGVCGATEGA
jgi:MoaA/NifB/PqqE/SkfB family radical SAM enzyme